MHARPPLARTVIDRDAAARDAADAGARFDADPTARVIVMRPGGRLLVEQRVDGSAPALQRLRVGAVAAPELRVYLGRVAPEANPLELRLVTDETADDLEPESARWVSLRPIATEFDESEAGLAAEAVGVANWHERHPRCPRCGAATEPVQAGWARRCEVDASLHFPRTDPAVIVLVTDDDDRVLLGSNASWETNRYSLLAGFVEPGESLEAAVVREIQEEAGLAVDRVEYVASQPWPFPASLMLGFTARVSDGADVSAAQPDGEEILELRWFDRDGLRAAAATGGVVLPGGGSIAAWLLERWFGAPVPTGPSPWSTR
ncbi:NAD(+) diphosphatase [Agromyces sp. LHK192]|uniref:NAD(+) diphosphatase n=1 Tax=Agromyces sp. LHK192 TaxID=2498704 RepID=UPI000FD95F77|nr:NAD(+) diphosphatase [Agromyces sp. LHK192]